MTYSVEQLGKYLEQIALPVLELGYLDHLGSPFTLEELKLETLPIIGASGG